MKLIVRPEWRVNHLELAERYAVVSLTDPAPLGRPANIEPRPLQAAVGRWEFVDLKGKAAERHPLAMQPHHAAGIWDFVHAQLQDGVETFVVHCFAAARRSPSVAIAIADCLMWPHANIDWHTYDPVEQRKRFRPPNPHVYQTMTAAFAARSK